MVGPNINEIALPLFLLSAISIDAMSSDSLQEWPHQCDNVSVTKEDTELNRMPSISLEKADINQQLAIKKISNGPRGCIFGPFSVMLYSPEILNRVQSVGEYIRFYSIIPKPLRELAILVTGREAQSPYEWYIHEPIALQSGVTKETVEFLAKKERPPQLSVDETIVYDFVTEINANKIVSDKTYNSLKSRFGEKGVVELTALIGYFTLLGQQLNVARTPIPEGVNVPFKAPWK